MRAADPSEARRRPWPPPETGELRARRRSGVKSLPGCSSTATGRRREQFSGAGTSRCSVRATGAATARTGRSGTSGSSRGSAGGAAARPRPRPLAPRRGTAGRPAAPSRRTSSGPPGPTRARSASSSSTSGGRCTSRTPSRCSRTWAFGSRTSTPASSPAGTAGPGCGSTTSASGSGPARPRRTSTRRARRSRGASRGSGRGRRRTTASTGSPSLRASTGGRSRCCARTRSTCARSASP